MTVATGTLATPCKVSIAAGARVRLRDVDINGAGEWTSYSWAGLTCLGDATIDLEGSNSVKGFDVLFAVLGDIAVCHLVCLNRRVTAGIAIAPLCPRLQQFGETIHNLLDCAVALAEG